MENQTVITVAAEQTTAPVAAKQTFASALFSAADAQAAIEEAAKQQPVVSTPKEKQARATKSASKPAVKKAGAQAAKKPYVSPIAFVVRGDGARKLFAHTAAWLEMTGLIQGKSAPVELIRALGGSALSYHTKAGNMAQSQGMVSLTAKGLNHFRARYDGSEGQNFANEDKEHYMLMMMEGITDDRLVKSQGAIVPASKYLG